MFLTSLVMLGAVIAMTVVARPRNGQVVPWLRSETRQQLYGFALVSLLSAGLFLAISG